ncbi:MAG: acetylglutamate kinase [Brevinematales bacterium]|nr:acetylglutamate kinase [Brevinematales bacterium]
MQNGIDKARVLTEAMPYIRQFYGSTIVVKYGGSAMDDETLKEKVILDFILMKLVGINLVVVHGGGPHITDMMKKLGKEAVFIDGHRVTDDETMEITEMVLSGLINKKIVSLINKNGGKAVGISGKDAMLIEAVKKAGEQPSVDLGQVGDISRVNPELLLSLTRDGFIPVISPVGFGVSDGKTYNVNADTAASHIAAAMKARRVIYMTDVRGLYSEYGDEKSFLESVDEAQIIELKKAGKIGKGMIPKIDAALYCLKNGAEKVHYIDGRVEHALLLELFTEAGIGTEIKL